MNAKDRFGALLAMGIVFQIGLQVALNIGVVSDFLPNKDFFKYGYINGIFETNYEVKYKEIVIGFLASKLTYTHELDVRYKELNIVESEENKFTVKNYSYDFNVGTEEVNYNVK